jgi:hypothetical protein
MKPIADKLDYFYADGHKVYFKKQKEIYRLFLQEIVLYHSTSDTNLENLKLYLKYSY